MKDDYNPVNKPKNNGVSTENVFDSGTNGLISPDWYI